MVFAEGEKWDWTKTKGSASGDLGETRKEGESEGEESDSEGAASPNAADLQQPADNVPQLPNEPGQSSEQSQGRIRRKPAWFHDYVTNEAQYDDEEEHNLAVFALAEDPTSFEEVAKNSNWRITMELELEEHRSWPLFQLVLRELVSSGFIRPNTMRGEKLKSIKPGW